MYLCKKYLFLRIIWRAFLSCYLRFEIRTFALSLTNYTLLRYMYQRYYVHRIVINSNGYIGI